jgi:hypothetical protein
MRKPAKQYTDNVSTAAQGSPGTNTGPQYRKEVFKLIPHLEFLLAVDPVSAQLVWDQKMVDRGMTAAVWAIPNTSLYIIDRQHDSVFWCKEAIDTDNIFSVSDGLAYAIKAANAYLVHFGEMTHTFHYVFVENPRKQIPDIEILNHYYPFLVDGFKLIKEEYDYDELEEYYDE